MIKIKINDQVPHGGCSYYRSLGPFSKIKDGVDVQYINKIGWHTIADADIVFFSRPQSYEYLEAIQITKNFGVPVWVDWDDLPHACPDYNPNYDFYSQKSTRDVIEKCIAAADIVTVSTNEIKKVFSKFNRNIQLIVNAHNDYNYRLQSIVKTNPFINWRGSPTHEDDLVSCQKEILDIADKYKQWYFSFIGDGTRFITKHIKDVYKKPELEITSYFFTLKTIAPKIHIIPLLDNLFNRAKSNCAWLEATWAGAAVIAPDFPEFNVPGVTRYKTPAEFGEKLEYLMNNEDHRQQQYELSLEHIRENYLLSQINKKRYEIIHNMVKNS